MLTLKIENEKIEHIFLNELYSNKEENFEFFQDSFDRNLLKLQEISMSRTWDNDKDKSWGEL